jgi:hypothetical protein
VQDEISKDIAFVKKEINAVETEVEKLVGSIKSEFDGSYQNSKVAKKDDDDAPKKSCCCRIFGC